MSGSNPTWWDALVGIAGWIAIGLVVLFLAANAMGGGGCSGLDDPTERADCEDERRENQRDDRDTYGF